MSSLSGPVVILFDVDEPPGRSVTNTHVYRVVLHQDEQGHNGSDHFKTSTGPELPVLPQPLGR